MKGLLDGHMTIEINGSWHDITVRQFLGALVQLIEEERKPKKIKRQDLVIESVKRQARAANECGRTRTPRREPRLPALEP